jgi:hypothetical protein
MLAAEYKRLVLTKYDELLHTGQLSSELLLPTPANIKAEVVKICEIGLSPQDEIILRSFVNEKADAAAYRKAFSTGKADPFRPLVTFLADRSVETNQRNIDLLALLIGFQPRPYHPNLKVPPAAPAGTAPAKPPTKEEPVDQEEKKKRKLWIVAAVVILAISVVGIWLVTISKKQYNGREGCMVWNHDQYEPIECSERSSGTKIYRIDHELIDHFQRITKPDTLTYYSVNKVWYANQNGRVDFYTHSGPYPLDTNFRVLPMSRHIWEKYVLHLSN